MFPIWEISRRFGVDYSYALEIADYITHNGIRPVSPKAFEAYQSNNAFAKALFICCTRG